MKWPVILMLTVLVSRSTSQLVPGQTPAPSQGPVSGMTSPVPGLTSPPPGMTSTLQPGLSTLQPGLPTLQPGFSGNPAMFPPPPGLMSVAQGPVRALDALFGGLGSMGMGLEGMGFNLARYIQGMYQNALMNGQTMSNLGPGERSFTTHDGGRGIMYNSPDGSFSTFSFSSGGPSSGVMYYQGPDGLWERRW